MPYLSGSTYVKALVQYLPSSKCSIVGSFFPLIYLFIYLFCHLFHFVLHLEDSFGSLGQVLRLVKKIFCLDTGSLILDYTGFC